MAAHLGPTLGQGPDLPDHGRRRVEAPRLAELAPARIPAGGDRGWRDRRPAPLPAERVIRVAAAWEGRSLAYVAEQAGHSIATLAKHYAGVIRELENEPRKPAAEAVREAREQVRCATDVRKAELASP